jgi:cysteinyl-tRNA synthetase
MAAAHLGETIDIHAGGVDLVFPHHENEIAQSTCAHDGRTFARFWLHNGMLTFGGAKMSKSVGNVKQLHALIDQYPNRAEALRYALLSAHYRQPLDWSEALIEQSIATLDRLYGTLRDLAQFDLTPGITSVDFENALDDDLNTPIALAVLNNLAKSARQTLASADLENESVRASLANTRSALLGSGSMIGLLQQDPEAWFQGSIPVEVDLKPGALHLGGAPVTVVTQPNSELIDALITERSAARAARDFARADAIRDELAAMGIAIEDGPQGTRWKVAER